MCDKQTYRELGPLEQYLNKCHENGGNQNIRVALTIHTRTPLDPGVLQVGLQELQHQNQQLTARIKTTDNRAMFVPMECPVLPLDTQFTCKDFLHEKFNTDTGPLWRVQIVSSETLEQANIAFGPEVEAIIEDDSTVETRWRYFLRYMQGQLNSDIESFDESSGDEDEGRSVIFLTFHPSITDAHGALNLSKQLMDILGMKLEDTDSPLSLGGGGHDFPDSLETILPSQDSFFHFGDLVPMVRAVGNHWLQLRRSPCEPLLVKPNHSDDGSQSRSLFLRGWLSEPETRELVGQCGVEDVSLHGIVLAAALTSMTRVSVMNEIPPEVCRFIRATIATNLRQYCSKGSRNGSYSSVYEEQLSLPAQLAQPDTSVTPSDLWSLAHQLTNSNNTAKLNKQAMRHVRMIGKMQSSGGMEAAFKDMLTTRRVDSELHLNILGDLGHIFRRECSPSEQSQIRLEDVMLMVSAQNMGYPVSHSAHLFRGRLCYSLSYFTNYVSTSTALALRDETINLLRLAAETE